jgi:hypothetical protein
MTEETATAAIAKSRTDLPEVTSRELGAAQGAMGVRARGAVIDKNEAEHVGPPNRNRFPREKRRDLHRHLASKIDFAARLFPQSPFSDCASSLVE